MAVFKVLASHFGLESTGYGRAFRSKDEIFRIVAINPNRSKCPINAERVADGRGFNFPTGNVALRLSSVHALKMYTLCSFKSIASDDDEGPLARLRVFKPIAVTRETPTQSRLRKCVLHCLTGSAEWSFPPTVGICKPGDTNGGYPCWVSGTRY